MNFDQNQNVQSNEDFDQLKQKREEFATNIRKKAREDLFTGKRGHFNDNIESTSIGILEKAIVRNHLDGHPLRQQIEEWTKTQFEQSDFPKLFNCIQSNDLQMQHYGAIGVRKILSVENSPPIQMVIDANLVPKLISFMKQNEQSHLQLEAAWALTNIASGTTQQTQSIIDKGGIPLFVQILQSPFPEVAEQSIWAIGNIAGDSVIYRDMILRAGGINPLINIIMNSNNKNTIKHGTWALSNLCRGDPLPEYKYVKNSIPCFCKVIKEETDKEVIQDACWAMSYLSDGDDMRIQYVIDTGVVPFLINLLDEYLVSIIIPALRTIGNIITGNDQQTEICLQAGVLDKLFKLLNHEKVAVRRETCWCLSNIAAGNQQQISLLYQNPQYMNQLFNIIKFDTTEIKREAVWIISNSTNKGSDQNIKQLVDMKFFDIATEILDSTDVKTLGVTLEAIKNILETGRKFYTINNENIFLNELESLGTIKKIENLQYNLNEEIYHKALNILETYCEIEDPL